MRRPRTILIGIGVLLLVCVVLGIIGAMTGGGKSKMTATTIAAVKTPAPTTAATITPTAAPTKATTVKPAVAPTTTAATTQAATDATAQLTQFVDAHFGGSNPVAWYPKLTGLTILNHTVIAQTTLQPTANDGQLAVMACQNLSTFVFGNEHKALGLDEVMISGTNTATGQDSIPLANRTGLNGRCAPLAQP